MMGRLYRLTLYLFPAEFRHRYGTAMADQFDQQRRLVTSHRFGPFTLMIRAVMDGVRHGLALRMMDVRRRSRSTSQPPDPQRGWGTDARHVLKALGRSPSFTFVAMSSLALGIGATSAIFSLSYAIWLKPLPYRAPDELVAVQQRHPSSRTVSGAVSGPEAEAYRTATHSFTGVASFGYGAQIIRVNGERVRTVAYTATPNLFDVLGARPAIGRTFVAGDVGQHVVVLGHAIWMSRFGGDPDVLSRTFELSNVPYTIIGVMPPGFRFPQVLESDVWLASDFARWTDRSTRQLELVARLAPGATIEAASRDVAAVSANLARAYADTNAGWIAQVVPLDHRDRYRSSFGSLLGLVGLFLLGACANVAGLLLARNTERRGELAVRASLGASRARLARLMLLEAGALAVGGGAAGVALAYALSRVFAAALPRSIVAATDVQISSPVLAFTVAVSALTALLCGVLPSLGTRSISASEALTGMRVSGPRSQRLQTTLVIGEVGIAMVLLVGATLMAHSFVQLLTRDRGFDPRGVFALNVSLPWERYQDVDPAVRGAALEEVVAHVARVPGVTHAGATNGYPGSALGVLGGAMLRSERPGARPDVQGILRTATPGYFAVMGVALRAGRVFTAQDTATSPHVAIVNETLAHAMWADQPIGRQLALPTEDNPSVTEPWTVVGVVADMHLGSRVSPDIFLPVVQRPPFWIDLVIRTKGDPNGLMLPVRSALRQLNPDFLIENSTTLGAVISSSLGLQRAQSVFTIAIATLAAMVAGVGLYALIALSVAQRSREFAIRLALGVSPHRLARWILFRGLRPAFAGVLTGCGATAMVARALRSQVFGFDTAVPWSYPAAAAALLTIAVIALWIPARRVLHADPSVVMRGD